MAINSVVELETIKAILKLMQKKPFYGYIIQQFDKIYVPAGHELSTAAVGKGQKEKTLKLYINEGYFGEFLKNPKKGKPYILSVIEHEIIHVVMGHLFISFSDPTRGNIACDLVCNQYIDPVHDNWMTCERYNLPKGKSCYWYYDELKKNQKYQDDVKSGAFGEKGLFGYMKDAHSKWKGVEGDDNCEGLVKDMMRKAREASNNQYGDVHDDIKTFLDEYLKLAKPKIPWNRVLRLFVSSAAESTLGSTIMRTSKRYGTRPGTKLEEILNIAVTIDTSGSISEEDLLEFFSEIKAIWKNGAVVEIIEADCAVCRTYQFNGKFDGSVTGRGGTDLEPALKYVDDKRKFDAHIYFTDFYAPKITKRYKTPTLWVLTSEMDASEHPYEWGKKVNLRSGRPV